MRASMARARREDIGARGSLEPNHRDEFEVLRRREAPGSSRFDANEVSRVSHGAFPSTRSAGSHVQVVASRGERRRAHVASIGSDGTVGGTDSVTIADE